MLIPVRRAPANLDKPTEIVRRNAVRLPWAWHGLCFGVPLHDANNEGLRDIVNNIAPTTANYVNWVRDNRGNPAVKFTVIGADPWVGWADNPVHDSPSTAITAYVRLRPTVDSYPDGCAFYNPHHAAPPWSTWGIANGNPDPTTMYGSISLGTTTEYTTPFTGSIPTTEWYSVFLRWQSGGFLTLDVVGERGNLVYSVASATALTGSLGYNPGRGIKINAEDSGTTNAYALYSQAMVWNRQLTDTEMSALVSDPYGWYSPNPESLGVSGPYPLIGGAGEMRFGTGSGGLR